MKKLLSILFTFTITFSCLFLGGCNGNLSGEYYLETIKYYDYKTNSTVTVGVGDKYHGTELTKSTFILIIEEDECFLRWQEEEDDGTIDLEVYKFQWSKGYDNEYYACSNEEEDYVYVAKKNGNQIIFDFYGTLIFLKK